MLVIKIIAPAAGKLIKKKILFLTSAKDGMVSVPYVYLFGNQYSLY